MRSIRRSPILATAFLLLAVTAALPASTTNPAAAPATHPSAPANQSGVDGRALMQKVVEAMGGEKALGNLKALGRNTTANIDTAQGPLQALGEDLIVFPDMARSIFRIQFVPMSFMTMVVTPNDAFIQSTRGVEDMPRSQRADMLAQIHAMPVAIARRANDPALKFTAAGTEKVGEVETQILDIEGAGIRVRWYVDPKGRVIRAREAGPSGELVTDYTKLEQIGAVVYPLAESTSLNGKHAADMTVTEIDVNPTFDPLVFDRNETAKHALPFPKAPKR
jgi:hypothetical protein